MVKILLRLYPVGFFCLDQAVAGRTALRKGVAHGNGAIESVHGHLKQKIDQQLTLRGSLDFIGLAAYEAFLNTIVAKINRRCKTRYEEEKPYLQDLPHRRTHDFSELHIKVNSSY
jgi:hypothetical protein